MVDGIMEFRFWCQKVLPLVYDDSLSYYEVLCKLGDGFNKQLAVLDKHDKEIQGLQTALRVLEDEVEGILNGYPETLTDIIEKAIKNVWFGLTDSGYFVAYVPDSWSDVKFGTTGLDVTVPCTCEFGHLVVMY